MTTHRPTRFLPLLPALFAALALAACGGGGDGTSPAEEAPLALAKADAAAQDEGTGDDAAIQVGGGDAADGEPVATTGDRPTSADDASGAAGEEPALAALPAGTSVPRDAVAAAASGLAATGRMAAPLALASTVTMTKVAFTNSSGQALAGYRFSDPAAVQRNAAVVLMHGCSGIWSNGVVNTEAQPPIGALSTIHRRWGRSLAQAGYQVLLVDSFTPRGLTSECGNGSAGLNEAVERPRDAFAARAWLVAQGLPGGRIALLGWSNGASAVLAAIDRTNQGGSSKRPFRVAFAFYPGCGLLGEFGGDASTLDRTTWLPYAPVFIHHAALDPLYTAGRCTHRVNGAIALGAGNATGNAVSMTVYPGAHHSFDMIDLAKPLAEPFTADDQAAQQAADRAVTKRLDKVFAFPS